MGKYQEYYLLKNTAESLQMNQNIKVLIESKESENMMLALQLLETGGISFDTITYVFALHKWCRNIIIRNQAKYLFYKFASSRLQMFIKDTWKKEYLFETNENKIAKYLTILSGCYELNREDLGNIHLNLLGKGAKFCLENQTAPVTQILEQIIEENELSLANFDLQICPKEIIEFRNLQSLDISGNRFKTIPKELKNLTNLKYLYYKNTPIPSKILANTFPSIFKVIYQGDRYHKNFIKLFKTK